MTQSTNDSAVFEQAMQALEQVVHQLEAGDQGLEEALQAFEQGIKLTRQCQLLLDQAQQRVTQVLADNTQGDHSDQPATATLAENDPLSS